MKASKVIFHKELPQNLSKQSLLIYDKKFKNLSKSTTLWLKQFPLKYGVTSGEKLKDIKFFPQHIEKIMKINLHAELPMNQIICLGGGSIGDFSGFIASVWKRGIPLIHIPSTWLAAIDSSHGGKNALNVSKIKNQIGTFKVADEIHIVKSILFLQSKELATQASAELLKILLLAGSKKELERIIQYSTNPNLLWEILPQAIDLKNRIVAEDPLETKGIRLLLNLGHTVGHAIESHLGLSHGEAVAAGLKFALKWSVKRQLMSETTFKYITPALDSIVPLALNHSKIPVKKLINLLKQDKKIKNNFIKFVFLREPGKPEVLNVTADEIAKEASRQGLAK